MLAAAAITGASSQLSSRNWERAYWALEAMETFGPHDGRLCGGYWALGWSSKSWISHYGTLNLEVGQTRKIPKRFSRGCGGAAGFILRWPEESALSGRGVGRKRDGTTEGFRDEYFLMGRL